MKGQKQIIYGATVTDPASGHNLYSGAGSLRRVLELLGEHMYCPYLPNYQKVRRELVAGWWASIIEDHDGTPLLIQIKPDVNPYTH